MPLPSSIVELLKREKIPYTCFRHAPAYTAQEEAAVSHISGRCWAKVVICIADEQPVQAVLRLAREEEIARLYPEFEVGAMPPFGKVNGQRFRRSVPRGELEGGELYQQAFAEGKLNVFGGNTIAVEAEGEHAAQGGAIAHSVCGKRAEAAGCLSSTRRRGSRSGT